MTEYEDEPAPELLVCDHCGAEFDRPRPQGRRPRFCPGDRCRRAAYHARRRAGIPPLPQMQRSQPYRAPKR